MSGQYSKHDEQSDRPAASQTTVGLMARHCVVDGLKPFDGHADDVPEHLQRKTRQLPQAAATVRETKNR